MKKGLFFSIGLTASVLASASCASPQSGMDFPERTIRLNGEQIAQAPPSASTSSTTDGASTGSGAKGSSTGGMGSSGASGASSGSGNDWEQRAKELEEENTALRNIKVAYEKKIKLLESRLQALEARR